MKQPITIGSRGSKLALWQANYAKHLLEEAGYAVSITIISTKGDRIQHLSFDKLEGKGFFTKELEDALLAGAIDLAVHSFKDLPSLQPPGLVIAGMSDRADPADVLLIRKEKADVGLRFSLSEGALVGTSSARRKSQLLFYRPDVKLKDIRGNVPTRIEKLREGQFDAIIMAQAGLDRIAARVDDLVVYHFAPTQFIPAPAQGVLAYQVREEDHFSRTAVQQIADKTIEPINHIERKTLQLMDGGCQIPLGIYAIHQGNTYHAWCSYADSWDGTPNRIHIADTDYSAIPAQLVKGVQQHYNANIFISREQQKSDLFYRLLSQRGCAVLGTSLVNINPVAVGHCPPAPVYCFASRNAVKSLWSQHPNPPAAALWALGEGTAAAIREVGWTPAYIGNGDAKSMAAALAAYSPAHIVFPTADHSRSSIQKALPDSISQEDLIVYGNTPKVDVSLPVVTVAVLTSPQNAAVFLANYTHRPWPHLIAIGQPTYDAIKAAADLPVQLAYTPTEWGLADAVFACLLED